jgi:hypothetical protein
VVDNRKLGTASDLYVIKPCDLGNKDGRLPEQQIEVKKYLTLEISPASHSSIQMLFWPILLMRSIKIDFNTSRSWPISPVRASDNMRKLGHKHPIESDRGTGEIGRSARLDSSLSA